MTTDFNHAQMQHLLAKWLGVPNQIDLAVSVVYAHVSGDYWLDRDQFQQDFLAVPINNYVVIHLRFEGISISHCGLVECVQKLIQQQQRKNQNIFVFSPNNVVEDSPWPNLFYPCFLPVTDEIGRSRQYWAQPQPIDTAQAKTWALFVGRRTMPRMLALWHVVNGQHTANDHVVSLMRHTTSGLWAWQNPEFVYDHWERWHRPDIMPNQAMVLDWIEQPTVHSIDHAYVSDQYKNKGLENRNTQLIQNLLAVSSQYLFEITCETMTEGLTFTPSEKTIRPILAMRAQFVYAAPGFLYRLRKLGFRTWHNVWDESYDTLAGPDRFSSMFSTITDIARQDRSTKLALFNQTQLICEHNRQRLQELAKK